MGSSGLIYAAIVAAWAAVLVPRWVRRNEEVEQAREVDLARGVRVLPRPEQVRKVGGSPTHRALQPDVDDSSADDSSVDDASEDDSSVDDASADDASDRHGGDFGVAARRRRRVLLILTLVLAVSTLASIAGRLPGWAVAVPVVLLAVFLVLARRAAVAEARRRPVRRRSTARAAAAPVHRVAVLEEPEPVAPEDPDAWEPVPVPLPTYVTKARAPDPGSRRIDLSQPGAWTSGRLDPAGRIALPRAAGPAVAVEAPSQDADDLRERRRAVGD
ncbi:MAG TPA: hypothetical protein VFH02_05125 [Jiangellaceae bacterium]|nr:hypothetical protein [Jiangellaceae bacterium]